MKVVLFCGGLGTRLWEHTQHIPKPMVPLGARPILWHVMKYYAHFGHRDFILCLGYRGDIIRRYFLEAEGAWPRGVAGIGSEARITLSARGMEGWTITFVHSGLEASVGQRLRAVEPYLEADAAFLANYADGLSDLPLPDYLEHFRRRDRVASFLCVRPRQSFHVVSLHRAGRVRDFRHIGRSPLWVNGGFFAFKRAIARTSSRSRSGGSWRGASWSRTGTGGSGPAWTRSRTSSSSTSCARAGARRGSCGQDPRADRPSPRRETARRRPRRDSMIRRPTP